MSWAQHEKDFVINYLKTTYWNESAWTLFSDKTGKVWRAKWSDLDKNFNDNEGLYNSDCAYCRFRGISRSQDDSEWNVNEIDLKHEKGTTVEISNSTKPRQKDDVSDNYNSSDDRNNFRSDSNQKRKPLQLSGGIEKSNYIPGYYRVSYVNGSGSGDTGKFLLSDRGGSRWRQVYVLYKIHTDKNTFANDLYDNNQELVSNIIYRVYYQNKGRYGDGCKNRDQRFDNTCKDICTNLYSKDSNIVNNCNQGLINYSSNCINGNQRYDNNCTFTCDPKWTDGTLRDNCNYGIAQECNDNNNYQKTDKYSTCESTILDTNNKFNNMPYNSFKDSCFNDPNQDFCKQYFKNTNILNKFTNDINKDCDFTTNRNNYDKCKKFINNSDFLGGKFINWCKDNPDNNNCQDLLNNNESLRDRFNNLYLTTICSQTDKIIKDQRCKNLLDSDNNNLNLKNDAEDILAKYCNTDNKTFNTDPLDDSSCYRIANNKCATATTDSEKEACNKYYINIIKKLEEKTHTNDNVLYMYYDNILFNNLPVFYKFKKTINLSNNDNPKNFTSINQSIMINTWSTKVFAFIQPDTTGKYKFQINADDGIRFYINNNLLLDNYPQYTAIKESIEIDLTKNIVYFFYFEFYENYGDAILTIKYKKDNETEYKDIPDSWYKPFKLYNNLSSTYEASVLQYMQNYPQNFLSDNIYKTRLKNENPDIYKSIVNYCKQNDRLKDDNNDCVKFTKDSIDLIINNDKFNSENKDPSCDSWADSGECTRNPTYMLQSCPKSCKDKDKNKLFNSLFDERLDYCRKLLESSNYTNEYAIKYILNELIPYLKKIYNNNIANIFTYLKSKDIINQKILDFAENDNNIEFTNNYIKSIYEEFKDIPEINNSFKKIIVKRCKKVNSSNSLRFSVEDQCINYIKTDTGLNQTIIDYCNDKDNMKNSYCTDLDNSIINSRTPGKTLPVNLELANNLNNARINYTKNKLKSSNYTDDYSIKYINNQYKTLVDLQNTNSNDRNKKYIEMIDKDTIKYCEDNYLEYENTTKPFCKQTFDKFKSALEINNSINKIKEQTCLLNNKFITDTECNKYANEDKNYIKFINANNKYCSIGDNITNQYCQDYYKNTENKINQVLIQNNCNNMAPFDNKEEEHILHNVELESFENNIEYNFSFIYMLLLFVIIALLIPCYFKSKQKKNINSIK